MKICSLLPLITLSILTNIIFLFTADADAGPNADANANENQNPPVKSLIKIFEHHGEKFLAFYFDNQPEWYTYWKNPGSTGLPFSFKIDLDGQPKNSPQIFEELEWPTPQRFIKGATGQEEWAFGHKGVYGFFFKLPPPKVLSATIENRPLSIEIHWLACKNVCVPGEKKLMGKIVPDPAASELTSRIKFVYLSSTSSKSEKSEFEITPQKETEIFENIPSKSFDTDSSNTNSNYSNNLKIHLIKNSQGTIFLNYTFNVTAPTAGANASANSADNFLQERNLLTPFPHPLFSFGLENLKHENLSIKGEQPLSFEGEYQTPPQTLPSNGIFSTPLHFKFLFANPLTKKVEVIEKKINTIEDSAVAKIAKVNNTGGSQPVSLGSLSSLALILLLALFGGLLLNLMPCVLPVISLKLFSLIRLKEHEKGGANINHGVLMYVAGISATFFLLSLIVIFLKLSGEAIGWGFHLQSPLFLSVITILLLLFTLNLFGLLEIPVPGSGSLGNVHLRGNMQEFFNGFLATILATPCSAPFLGTALTYAFTAPPLLTIMLFQVMALGLALPFCLIIPFPGLISIFPRPGRWMQQLKVALGIIMGFTILWPAYILYYLTNSTLHLLLLGAISTIIIMQCLLKYFYKTHYKTRHKTHWPVLRFFLLLCLTLSSAYYIYVIIQHEQQTKQIDHLQQSKSDSWSTAWSETAMENYRKLRQPLFIYFSAEWCLTCKINEKLIIRSKEFQKLLQTKNVKVLMGDWSHRDPTISAWLRSHDIVGVPAYFVQTGDGKLIKLGEMITTKKVKEALEQAQE
ncbi:MAG: thioredoxin family protein [Oligoflexia bacterium]|nr:thioredoxin family protein [Oligoflexia bacterium]